MMEVVPMLMRSDPFRELDRLTQQVFGSNGTLARPSVMPMDAWREGDTFHVEFDLPGIRPDSIDLDDVFSRQLVLGDNLDTEHIDASYDAGVLT